MEKGYSNGELTNEYNGPSWTTIRTHYLKNQANNPSSKWYGNKSALEGKSPIDENGQKIILHHPAGRSGKNIEKFIEMPENEHRAFHIENGYHYDPSIGWY